METIGIDNTDDCRKAEQMVKNLLLIKEQAKSLNSDAIEQFVEKNKEYPRQDRYASPLYDLENKTTDASEKCMVNLAEALLKKWQKKYVPNVPVSLDKLIENEITKKKDEYNKWEEQTMRPRDLDNGFNPEWLSALFLKKYYIGAREKSIENISLHAKKLIPYNLKETCKVYDILFGKVLRLYLNDTYHHATHDPNMHREEMQNFNKLAKIVLANANPIFVDSLIYPDAHPYYTLTRYKNGRLDIRFQRPEFAKKVAEALVDH